MQARAVLVDMEEGVVNEVLKVSCHGKCTSASASFMNTHHRSRQQLVPSANNLHTTALNFSSGDVGPLQGRLGGLFDAQQLLTDVSGSGNNWAHGHHLYGPQYRDSLLESIRRPVEACESLQSFLLLQSLGGGTGSGLGCYILNLLEVR